MVRRHAFTASLLMLALPAAMGAAVPSTTTDQAPMLPSVTVPTFTSTLPLETRRSLADELAAKLVATRRFRVLRREWLPATPTLQEPAPLDLLREAATKAGVDYIVQGSTTSVIPRAPEPRSRFLLPMLPLLLPSPPAERILTTSIHVCVVDVASGAVVRTSVAGGGGRRRSSALSDIAHTLNLADLSRARSR